MSIRDLANKSPLVVGGIVVLVLGYAVYSIIGTVMPKGRGTPIKAVYFYDLTTGKLFTAPPQEMSPIDVPSGEKITHRKKEKKAGFRAYVFACGGCPADMTGMAEADVEAAGANLAYIDRYTDEALETQRKFAEQMGDGEGGVRRMPGPMGMFEMGRLIGKAPSKPGEYPKLYGQMDPAGSNLARDALVKCDDGTYPKQCIPK